MVQTSAKHHAVVCERNGVKKMERAAFIGHQHGCGAAGIVLCGACSGYRYFLVTLTFMDKRSQKIA